MSNDRVTTGRWRLALAPCLLMALGGCNPLAWLVEAIEPDWLTEIKTEHVENNPVIQAKVGVPFQRAKIKSQSTMGKPIKNAQGEVVDVGRGKTEISFDVVGTIRPATIDIVVLDPEWADQGLTVSSMTLTLEGEAPLALPPPTLVHDQPMFRHNLTQDRAREDAEIAALAELDSDVATRLGTPLVPGPRLDTTLHFSTRDRGQRHPVQLKVRGPKGVGVVRAEIVTPAGGPDTRSHIEGLAFGHMLP